MANDKFVNRLCLLLLVAGATVSASAARTASAQEATTAVNLRMRAGPSTMFPIVDVIPSSSPIVVNGCVRGRTWCDVSAAGSRGWVFSRFLRKAGDKQVPILQASPRTDLPIVGYSVEDYWDDHYRNRSWFSERAYWRDRWREQWPEKSRTWRSSGR